MTKAEERALEFLPSHPNEGIERQRKRFRQMYEAGYEQAEKDMFQTILVVLEKDYGFDTLDRVEFVMKYERMTGESIPDDWFEKGVMKTVKLQSLEQKKNAD